MNVINMLIYGSKHFPQDPIHQARANYSPGPICGLLRFLIQPAKLEEFILTVSK